MAPLKLSLAWYRRLFIAIIAASVVYGTLYVMHTAITKPLFNGGGFDVIALSGTVASLLLAVTGLFISRKHTPATVALLAFLVFAVTTAYSVQQSGGVESPFIAFWGLVVFFSPIFGAYGWLPTLIMTGSYTAGAYLNQDLTIGTSIGIALSSVLPLGLGLYIFRDHAERPDPSGNNVKHLASQLSEVATKSEIIINAIGDGVIAVDAKGIIQLINPAAQKILGWSKQDALLLNYKSVFRLTDEHSQPIEAGADPVQQVLNTNQQLHNNKLIARTKADQKVSVAITVSPIDTTGSGVIVIFRDVTKERAEEREQAEFISTASHEMRTPVASIEGYLGLALNANTATIDDRARDFITKAQDSAQHLGRLFQDLLDVSMSEDGRMTSIPKVTDMAPFIQSLVENLTHKAEEKGLKLVFNAGQAGAQRKLMPVYYVHQDPSHMREIVDNLIENAVKYTLEGEVTVDIAGSEDRVVISVKDTGLGIPAEDLPHLFQKFYRVANTDRQEIGGTGLGLYLTRRLAESMNGRIWAESTFKEGSTFFVELPRISTAEAETLLKQEAAAQPSQPVSIPITSADDTPPEATIEPTAAHELTSTAQPPATEMQTPEPVAAPAVAMPVAAPAPAATSAPAPAQPVAQPAPQPQQPQPPVQQVAPQLAVQQPIAQQPATPVTPVAPAPLAQAPAPQPQVAAQPQPVQTAPVSSEPQRPTVQPARNVPRGESLTRDQIAERVRQLEALSQQQREQSLGRQ